MDERDLQEPIGRNPERYPHKTKLEDSEDSQAIWAGELEPITVLSGDRVSDGAEILEGIQNPRSRDQGIGEGRAKALRQVDVAQKTTGKPEIARTKMN